MMGTNMRRGRHGLRFEDCVKRDFDGFRNTWTDGLENEILSSSKGERTRRRGYYLVANEK